MKYYIKINSKKSKRFKDWYIYHLDYDNMKQKLICSLYGGCDNWDGSNNTELIHEELFTYSLHNIYTVDVLTESEAQQFIFMEKL